MAFERGAGRERTWKEKERAHESEKKGGKKREHQGGGHMVWGNPRNKPHLDPGHGLERKRRRVEHEPHVDEAA